jgi:hypothetical protein
LRICRALLALTLTGCAEPKPVVDFMVRAFELSRVDLIVSIIDLGFGCMP